MTDAKFVALTVAVSACVSALPALIVAMKNGRKADEIHTLVNSGYEAVKNELKAANVHIEILTAALLKRPE